jgi:hypothetical protein
VRIAHPTQTMSQFVLFAVAVSSKVRIAHPTQTMASVL